MKEKVPTVMAVLEPIKVVITNWPEGKVEYLEAENNAANEALGTRQIPFTKNLYIERDDFSEQPPKKYNRLVMGGEVRLKHAYFIKCHEVIKDNQGNIIELRCTYDPETKSGSGFMERKVKGTIHWVSEEYGRPCKVRVFEDLFTEVPTEENLFEKINPQSILIREHAVIEPAALDLNEEGRFQFIRHGYFIKDSKLSVGDKLIFNRSVGLKSSYK